MGVVLIVVSFVAAAVFFGWCVWTAGYDAGWSDGDSGVAHRDDRKMPLRRIAAAWWNNELPPLPAPEMPRDVRDAMHEQREQAAAPVNRTNLGRQDDRG